MDVTFTNVSITILDVASPREAYDENPSAAAGTSFDWDTHAAHFRAYDEKGPIDGEVEGDVEDLWPKE